MIDSTARGDLALHLRWLVTGRITNYAFDDRYEEWKASDDAAVSEIATFGWGLYSDMPCYRLKGRNAVTRDMRREIARAILFLQSNREYEWPTSVLDFDCLWGPGCYAVLSAMLLYVTAFPTSFEAVIAGLIGVLALFPAIHWLMTDEDDDEQLEDFHASGDRDVWPFLRRADFEKAKNAPKWLTEVAAGK